MLGNGLGVQKDPAKAACDSICLLTHDLINKLTIITGECELLALHASDPECVARAQTIRTTAESVAAEIKNHQCRGIGSLRMKNGGA